MKEQNDIPTKDTIGERILNIAEEVAARNARETGGSSCGHSSLVIRKIVSID